MLQRTSLAYFTNEPKSYGGQIVLTVPPPGVEATINLGGAKTFGKDGYQIRKWAPGSYTFNVSDDGKVARLTGFVAHEDKGESEP